MTVSAATTAAQPPTEPSREELLKRIDDLQRRVQVLEAQQRRRDTAATRPALRPSPTTRPTAVAAARTVEAVTRDADRRSQPFAASTAGYDSDGFFIRSEDERFQLRPSVFTQFRYVTNSRDGSADGDDYDLESGFEIRRMRFSIDGTLFTPRLQYGFTWSADRDGGDVSLLDAEVEYEFADAWTISLGQFKPPTAHEELTSARRQLAVERSLVNELLVPGRVQGLALQYGEKRRPLRVRVMYHDGADSLNTNFRDPPANDTNYGVAGRVEYKLLGKWADYRDFTAKGTNRPLLVLGAGTDWTEAGDTNVLLGTIDLHWEHPTGFTGYAAVLGSRVRGAEATGDDRTLDWGGIVQAGYLVHPRWEPFARYDLVHLDDAAATFHEFTIGFNHYLGSGGRAGHRAKLTADLLYLPEGAPSNESGLGILESGDDELILRLQVQLIL